MPLLGLSRAICVLKRRSLNYKSRERSCNAIIKVMAKTQAPKEKFRH